MKESESLLADHDRRLTETIVGGVNPRGLAPAIEGQAIPIPPKATYRILAPGESIKDAEAAHLDAVRVTIKTCDACSYAWHQYHDGPAACPRCNPDQPKPLALRRQDPNEHMGTEWYWENYRGLSGMWMPIQGMAFVPVDELRPFCEMLHDLGAPDGVEWISAATQLIERLQRENEELRNPAEKKAADGAKLLRCNVCTSKHGAALYYREERGCGMCAGRAARSKANTAALPAIGSRWKHSGSGSTICVPEQLGGWAVAFVSHEKVRLYGPHKWQYSQKIETWPGEWSPDEETRLDPIEDTAEAIHRRSTPVGVATPEKWEEAARASEAASSKLSPAALVERAVREAPSSLNKEALRAELSEEQVAMWHKLDGEHQKRIETLDAEAIAASGESVFGRGPSPKSPALSRAEAVDAVNHLAANVPHDLVPKLYRFTLIGACYSVEPPQAASAIRACAAALHGPRDEYCYHDWREWYLAAQRGGLDGVIQKAGRGDPWGFMGDVGGR